MINKIKQIFKESTLIGIYSILLLTIVFPNISFGQNLFATCSVNPLAINLGERAVWTVEASGGNGNYGYYWTGSDGLIGDTKSVSKIYDRSGIKTATVNIFSDGQNVAPTCSLNVLDTTETLTGTCFVSKSIVVESETVLWTVEAFGGDGRYKFIWDGADGLGGSNKSVSKKYNSTGTKNASVTITSLNQSTVRKCSVRVEPDPDLEGFCFADLDYVKVGSPVTWTAQASGGSGIYKYSWSGSGVNGSRQALRSIYGDIGEKTAQVEIFSGSQSITRICSTVLLNKDDNSVRSNKNLESDSGVIPLIGGNRSSSDADTNSGFSFIIWRIISTIVLVIGASIFSAMIIYFRKQSKDKEVESLVDSPHDKETLEIIQSEATKREIVISIGATKLLIEKTGNDILKLITHLHNIIDELKHSMPVPVEKVADTKDGGNNGKWHVIDETIIEKYFSTHKK